MGELPNPQTPSPFEPNAFCCGNSAVGENIQTAIIAKQMARCVYAMASMRPLDGWVSALDVTELLKRWGKGRGGRGVLLWDIANLWPYSRAPYL